MTERPDPIETRDLVVRLGGRPAVSGASLTLARGRVTGLVGPNGSGKTTLLRTIFRATRPQSGGVYVDGRAAETLARRELARRISAVVQDPDHPPGVTVEETIETGRFPHRGDAQRWNARDRDAVRHAAVTSGVAELLGREVGELSGGERQRVHVARALAQEAPVLLLDEPTNHLDIRHQFALMETLRDLAASGTTVGLAIHDLGLAARYCDVVAVLDAGRVEAYGAPAEVLVGRLTREVFGVEARQVDGRLVLDPVTARLTPGPA